jgi:capsular polysaccharide biosynthesis protein
MLLPPAIERRKRAILVPARMPTPEERRDLQLREQLEFFGGIADAEGRAVASSAIMRHDRFAITHPVECPEPADHLDEDVVFGGLLFTRHYGHFMVESLARLWNIANCAGLTHVFLSHPGVSAPSGFSRTLFGLLGLDPMRVLVPQRPVRFRSVTIPGAAITLSSADAHPVLRNVFARISDAILQDRPRFRTSQPIYVSRGQFPLRVVHGEKPVEDLVARAGFRVVHPERLGIPEQIELANAAETYCGVLGSAMHNLMFARDPVTIHYIERTSNTPHTRRTFETLDRLMGHRNVFVNASCNTLPTFGQAGPFMIDPGLVRDALVEAGLVSRYLPFSFDRQAIEDAYRADWQRQHGPRP